MEGYYYHGIEAFDGCFGSTLETMIRILNEGLKTRKDVHKHFDDEFNHVCLYKKDKDWDYSDQRYVFKSARSGWIDRCFVFVIDPSVEAVKATPDMTDLIDEWRSIGDIPKEKIKGIALPLSTIKEYLDDQIDDEEIIEDKKKLKELLPVITELIVENNLLYLDSDMPNFTDELDNSLTNKYQK